MIEWLKYYFLGFFSDSLAKEGAERSFLNSLLSLLLTIVLVCGGLTAGYTASFGTHYSNAGQFREFMYAAFAAEDASKRIDLTVEGDMLTAKLPDGREYLNGFDSGEYTLNGYRLVVDTRAATEAYDDFKFICKNASGEEISYETFRGLSESEKQGAQIAVEYSGKTLDTAAKQAEYKAYLDKAATEGSAEYSADIASAYKKLNDDYASAQLTEKEYADGVYLLYAKAYYPSFSGVETYGAVPTVKTYYLGVSAAEEGNFCIILDDTLICSFVTDKGFKIDFGGYYTKAADRAVADDGMTAAQMQKNVDGLISAVFKSGGGYNFFVYFINTVKTFIILLGVLLLLALVVFAVCKWRKIEFGYKFGGAFKTECSFLLLPSLIAFIFAIVLPFFVSRGVAYSVVSAIVVALPVLRALVLLIAEFVRTERERKRRAAEESEAEEIS